MPSIITNMYFGNDAMKAGKQAIEGTNAWEKPAFILRIPHLVVLDNDVMPVSCRTGQSACQSDPKAVNKNLYLMYTARIRKSCSGNGSLGRDYNPAA